MKYASVFVAMSRVRCMDHVRLICHAKHQEIQKYPYLSRSQPADCVMAFYNGFSVDGSWKGSQALQYKKPKNTTQHNNIQHKATTLPAENTTNETTTPTHARQATSSIESCMPLPTPAGMVKQKRGRTKTQNSKHKQVRCGTQVPAMTCIPQKIIDFRLNNTQIGQVTDDDASTQSETQHDGIYHSEVAIPWIPQTSQENNDHHRNSKRKHRDTITIRPPTKRRKTNKTSDTHDCYEEVAVPWIPPIN
jgi:hypothetical protein